MTDFRTKGKGRERQVYPIGKRKPFGVPRELAFKDVQALRNEGKRARLIRTNRKLDLYAPYESVLPDGNDVPPSPGNSSENRKFSSYDGIEKAFSMTRSDAQAWADVHPELLTGSLRVEVERFNNPKDKPTGWDTSERVTLSTEYLRSTIRTMLGRKEFQNPRDAVLTLHLKRDYPVEIDTRRIGPKGEHIEVSGIIAPRMED